MPTPELDHRTEGASERVTRLTALADFLERILPYVTNPRTIREIEQTIEECRLEGRRLTEQTRGIDDGGL